MDAKELELWIATDEGKIWAEQLKKPLIDKRDELLGQLKAANGRIETEAQRATVAEQALEAEKKAIHKIIIDDGIAARLRDEGLMEAMIPHVLESIKEANGLEVEANGDSRSMRSSTANALVNTDELVKAWRGTPEGADFIKHKYTMPEPRGGNAEPWGGVGDELRRAMGLIKD